MNLPFFLARRIYRSSRDDKEVSRPAVLISMVSIAIGLAVMIVAVSVVMGFKREVRGKVVGFGAHIQVTSLDAAYAYEACPIVADDSLLAAFRKDAAVAHVQRYSVKAGMIKTEDAFQGMILKGVGEEYDTRFFRRHLVEGEMPVFNDSVVSNRVIISRSLANKLKLKLGDKIDTYYVQDDIRARRLEIAGIYQTNFSEYDNLFLLTDIRLVNRLNNWEKGLASGVEIELRDYGKLEEETFRLAALWQGVKDRQGGRYCVQNIEQLNPQVFVWLGILDVNIWVILVLMVGVAGFTMVSGLLILIIERTSMIGILKSLGTGNTTIRRLFLWLSVFLIGKGMLWGNMLGLTFYAVQKHYGLFRLDPGTYYMDTVPVFLNVWHFLLLNAGTLLASVLMLVGPSCIIARINPADSMRYE